MTGANSDRLAARLKLVDEHVRHENAHDLDAIMDTFGASAHYDDEPWGAHYVGRDQVRTFYQELLRFQQRRAETQQSQAAFSQARQLQLQNAGNVQTSRRQAMERSQNRPAATHREFRSPYAPVRNPPTIVDDRPPLFDISPWGAPIRWHPFANEWGRW